LHQTHAVDIARKVLVERAGNKQRTNQRRRRANPKRLG
jgi:hypothetical protein